jgi:predicted tellurium resistance membrane protein TerC
LIEEIFDVLGYVVLLIITLIGIKLLSENAKKTIFYKNVRFAIFLIILRIIYLVIHFCSTYI